MFEASGWVILLTFIPHLTKFLSFYYFCSFFAYGYLNMFDFMFLITFIFGCVLWCLDQIPYFEVGDSVTYNNEKEGIIECLKRNVDDDLDTGVSSLPDWITTKVMLTTWLADALEYELWVGCDGSSAYNIYYSDLPWPIGKILFWKKAYWVNQKHGISKDNAEVKEEEVSYLVSLDTCSDDT